MIIISALIGFVLGCALFIALKRKKDLPHPPSISRNLPQQEVSLPSNSAYLEEKLWFETQLSFLFNFDEKLTSAVGLQEVVQCIAEAAYNFLSIDHAVLLMWHKNSEMFTIAGVIGWVCPPGYKIIDKESISGFVIRNRQVLLVPDLDKDDYLKKLNKEEYLRNTFISAPLVYKDEVLGVLHVCGKRTGPFSQRDVTVVSNIARMGATSVQNACLYEQALKRAAELKIAYDELKDMHDKLVQSEKLKAIGQLASGVAHEMRNPLGTIMQGVIYLEQITPPESKEQRETISLIKDSATRADGIVISLLDFSKATKLDLHPENIVSILDNSLNLIKTELKSIKVSRQVQENLPEVFADKNKLMQVFINLFMNAVHAMPQGGELTIRGFVKPREQAAEEAIVIEIEDTGTGISEENLKKIFDPFFTTKGPGKGTGLGLSICHNIIAKHNGLLEIKSQENKGTKVAITLNTFKEGRANG